MKISDVLCMDMAYKQNWDRLQKGLIAIPFIRSRALDAYECGIDIDFQILEQVLKRLRENDLAISFIMSDKGSYEMVLLGVGKWRTPDKAGNHTLYKVIGRTICDSIYECVAKAVMCMYMFIQKNKRE